MEYLTEIRKAGTVLVVDDNPNSLRLVCTQLNNNNFVTFACRSGDAALEKLRENAVDAVLSDIRMPGGPSGLDLLVQLHSLYPEIPVILMTAYADLNTTIAAIKSGAFDFLIWPYEVEQLVFSVEKAVRFKVLSEAENEYRRILEDFNKEMETLISERTMNLMLLTIADKVRNPATVIGGLCRQMMERPDLPKECAGYLCDINDELRRLEQIVVDAQAVLKSRESLFTFADINELTAEAVSALGQERRGKVLALDVSLSAEPLRINMQKQLLRIALSHLLRNAVEATDKGGMISVRTSQEDGKAMIRISDTGCGIAPEILDHIFDPFFSTKAHRFGMGLPLVKQIVAEHLGEISVESEPGSGTSFSLIFPLRWKQRAIARETVSQDMHKESA